VCLLYSLTLSKEHGLGAFENTVVRKVFGQEVGEFCMIIRSFMFGTPRQALFG
jgi:hypothetical protein